MTHKGSLSNTFSMSVRYVWFDLICNCKFISKTVYNKNQRQ